MSRGKNLHVLPALALLTVALAGLFPEPVAAQHAELPFSTTEFFELFESDDGDGYTTILLHELFGPLFPSPVAPRGPTVFSKLIGFFNLAVLATGGLLLVYNIIVAVLQTAHAGELLGRQWSSLWAPLRVLFAAALLVPVPGYGGYNAVQTSIAWLVKGSTLMASEVWTLGASKIMSGDLPLTNTQPQLDGDVFRSVYRNQLCVRIANHQLALAENPDRVAFREVKSGDSVEFLSDLNGNQAAICGSYRIPDPPSYILRMGRERGVDLISTFRELHAESLRMMVEAADEIIASQWPIVLESSGDFPDIASQVADILVETGRHLEAGNRRMLAAVAEGRDSGGTFDEIRGFITGDTCQDLRTGRLECYGEGWIGAGNWYMTIAKLNAEILGMLNASVSATESSYIGAETAKLNRAIVASTDNPSWLGRVFGAVDPDRYMHTEEATRIWAAMTSEFDRASTQLAAAGFDLSENALGEFPSDNRSGWLSRIWRKYFTRVLEGVLDALSPSRWAEDPVVGIVTMGNWYLNLAASLLFGGTAASAVLGTDSSALTLIAIPLAVAGILQSFVLPLLPFLYWIQAVAGYFLLVAEAVVASSLWAFSHLRLDGEGLSGNAARTGWYILLGLAAAPVLMVLGFFAGMAILRIAAGLLDSGMFYAVSALINGSPIIGLFGLVAVGLIFVFSYIVIIRHSFSLVTEFPGRILRWVHSQATLAEAGDLRRIQASNTRVASMIGAGMPRTGSLLIGAGSLARQRILKPDS